MKPLRYAVSQSDGCLHTGHRPTKRDSCERTQGEEDVHTPRGQINPAATLILGFQPPELREDTCLWFKPPICGTLLRLLSRIIQKVSDFKFLQSPIDNFSYLY